jgi:hypothetical protein
MAAHRPHPALSRHPLPLGEGRPRHCKSSQCIQRRPPSPSGRGSRFAYGVRANSRSSGAERLRLALTRRYRATLSLRERASRVIVSPLKISSTDSPLPEGEGLGVRANSLPSQTLAPPRCSAAFVTRAYQKGRGGLCICLTQGEAGRNRAVSRFEPRRSSVNEALCRHTFRESCDAATTRKPMLSLRLSGLFLLRSAQRAFLRLLFHAPPRQLCWRERIAFAILKRRSAPPRSVVRLAPAASRLPLQCSLGRRRRCRKYMQESRRRRWLSESRPQKTAARRFAPRSQKTESRNQKPEIQLRETGDAATTRKPMRAPRESGRSL